MMKFLEEENKAMNIVVITGIGSGIGKEVAIELSKRKYFDIYALLGRNKDAIEETISEMKCAGAKKIIFHQVDLENVDELPPVIENIAQYGQICCLLNIAGYTDPKSLLSTSLENLERTYRINVFSPIILMRECTKYMKESGGKMLNVASTAGMTPRPGWLSYASSKASIISASQTLSAELAEYGIKVYCVSPGRCATKLRSRLAPDEDPTTIMQPHDVAKLICDLVSPEEYCLDGQNIVIRKQIT